MEEQQIAEQLLMHNRQEIDRADGKAVHALAVAGTAAAAVVGFVLGGGWSPRNLGLVQTWCWWAGAALWILGTVSLLLAIYPRMSGDPARGQLAYFGHVGAMEQGELAEALRRAATRPLDGVVSELHWTSRIVLIKYRFIRVGLVCLCLSLVSLAPQAL
ncbi:Pycsar system effector family protein [Micromonospora sp. NPDC049044]|uniref:Pycsar system effector family protein n=1 Tax=unclassified Micromonospora TaxID=2617518 RepID=UPI0033EB76FE